MNGKSIFTVVIVCLVTSVQLPCGATDSKSNGLKNDSALQIYLMREVTIKDDTIRLDQVGIIRGEERLVAKASNVTLGRISVPSQRIVVERSTVLSRLASNGIPSSKVTLSGAEKTTVKQQQQIIKGSEFVELASSFLKSNPPAGSVIQSTPIWIPKDLVVPRASKETKFSPRLVKSGTKSHAKVRIAVLADGKEIGVREVIFRLKYNCRRVVTLAEIRAGDVISLENVKIEKIVSSYPEPGNWSPPYGLVARRRLPANAVIRPDMVGPVRPEKVVKRNQTVVIRIERPGLLVTSLGKAMQEASAGEFIKVRNIDSQRIILAKVNEDGSVEPVL